MGISHCGGGSCVTWLILLLIYIFSDVTSALQTCSTGTETSSTQIMLDVSTTQINTVGGMCSCRLTVSQLTRVDMFPGVSWSSQCDTYMTIQKWATSTQCKEVGVGRSPPAQTHDVTTGEEIWILVVATKSGAKGLSGQLQFKVKQLGPLNIECFEPNTNSSTTTPTPSTTTLSTSAEATSMKTTSTRPSVSTETSSATSTTVSTPQTQTVDTSTSSSAGVTSRSSATEAENTQAMTSTPTQGAITENEKGTFPVAPVAGGIGGGLLLILIIIIAVTCYRRTKDNDHRILEDIPNTNKQHGGYVNHSYENEERVTQENVLYQSSGAYAKHPEEQAVGREEDNIQKQESSPVSGAPPVENGNGMKPSNAEGDPQPPPVSNDVSDMYAAVDEVQAGNPVFVDNDMYATADGISQEQPSAGLNISDDLYAVVNNPDEPTTVTADTGSQDGVASPSGDIYAVVNKSKAGEHSPETDGPGSQDSIVSPSGDIYAVVNKSKSTEDSAVDDVYAVVDKSRKHGSMDQDGSGQGEDSSADDQEAALNMMNSALDEGLDDTAPQASPTIQSTDL